MPKLTLENDPSIYQIDIREAGEISFDILEIVPVILKAGISDTNFTSEHVSVIANAMRLVASPKDIVTKCLDDQLFAAALKALAHWKKQGNV